MLTTSCVAPWPISLEVDTMTSAFENTLVNNVVEAMTKATEQAIVSGTGSGQPKGILTETPNEGQKIESDTPTYEDLVNAEAALPQAYENGAVWCMAKKTFMQYYGLVDETGQPVGRVNYGIAGKPGTRLAWPPRHLLRLCAFRGNRGGWRRVCVPVQLQGLCVEHQLHHDREEVRGQRHGRHGNEGDHAC